MRTRLVAYFACLLTCCQSGLAQQIQQRNDQFQAESEVLNAPSCVYFDAVLIESSEKTADFRQVRSVGRRVVGGKGQVRVDLMISRRDLNTGEESIQLEHFIRFGVRDYLKALGVFGSQLTIFDLKEQLEDGVEPAAPSGFNNPFIVVAGGEAYFSGNSNKGFVSDLPIAGFENAMRPASKPKASVVKLFTFSDEKSWAPTSVKLAVNPKAFDKNHLVRVGEHRFRYGENHLPTWESLKNPEQYVKDWDVATHIKSDWTQLGDSVLVPERIVCQSNAMRQFDRSSDFEVIYFGYDFEPLKYERLFDRQRFNSANIKQDFQIDLVVDQADKAKAQLQRKSKNQKR